MTSFVIGRKAEQDILSARLLSGEPELIAIYGRRRVGKTHLVRRLFEKEMVFELTGLHEAGMQEQLQNFSIALQRALKSAVSLAVPGNWLEAFVMLETYLDSLPADKPAVIFLDEFPWIHTQKSGFLQAFDHWWNAYGTKRMHLKVIICGSAASWMIENIINNRGGLHNRVTQSLRLLPFNLGETENYLKSRGIGLERYQLLQLYMAMGGIPHYLKEVKPGESAAQVIDRLCFTRDGLLRTEFVNLYHSLFTHSKNHEKVVRELAKKGKGLTRNEIIQACGFSSGGTTTKILRELEESGFIHPYIPFEKTANDAIYKLSDEYSLFYLKFIERPVDTGEGAWLRQFQTASYKSWSGFAFESVCQKHHTQIRRALGIGAVAAGISAWRNIPGKGKPGAQIDLLLDRADRCINLCEMKFSVSEFVIDKKYAGELDNKVNVFREVTGTKKTLFPTLITTYGARKNEHYLGRIQAEVRMDALFT